jgi:nitrogen-specific signal transduction histidine kinase
MNEVPIENDFHGDIDTILIDRGHIQSALVAVLRFLKENADEEEGRVVLSTHTPHPHSLNITIQGFETVSLGEDIHHAFIPLYTRKIARFGQELGLASAYGLLQSHGGSIKVEATHKGSKFHISLPLEEGPVS